MRNAFSMVVPIAQHGEQRTLWHRKGVVGYVFFRLRPRHREFAPVIPFMFARHKSRLVIATMTVLFCGMAGCGGPSRDVVGKWRMSQDANAMVWEFSKNGAVVIGSTRGRYILDRNRMKIETSFAKTVYQMEFSADRMILREPNGPKLEFTRLR